MNGNTDTHAAHPTARTYLGVALVLGVVTLVEFLILYVESLAGFMVPLLILLSVIKFALVALYYMHLRFDQPVFRQIFAFGLGLGILVAISLMLLTQMAKLPGLHGTFTS